jgi:hypothetical protein
VANNLSSRAQAILEAVDGLLLKPTLRASFEREKSKFRRQSSKPSLRHMTRVARELGDNPGFDPSTNPHTLPTIGRDSRESYFDLHPQSRMAPLFKRRLLLGDENDKKTDSPSKDKKKSSFLDQETLLKQGQDQDAQDRKFIQDQNASLQKQGLLSAQMSPKDAMQGGMVPPVPELPGDLRRSPDGTGNQAAEITQGRQSYSQRVIDRYDITKDPMITNPGPRTFSHRLRANYR